MFSHKLKSIIRFHSFSKVQNLFTKINNHTHNKQGSQSYIISISHVLQVSYLEEDKTSQQHAEENITSFGLIKRLVTITNNFDLYFSSVYLNT